VWAISCTTLDVIEGGGVAGIFDLLRSGSGDGRCQGAGQADDAVGAAGAVAAHDGDRNFRKIGRYWIVADGVSEVQQGWSSVSLAIRRHSSGKASHAVPPSP
jgi:hypothetical protein